MNIKKTKTNSRNQCEIPKQVWVYNVWSSVLYSFQVYYNSNLQPWKQLRELWVFLRIKQWTFCFFLPCFFYLSFDKPLRIKEGNIMFQISSVAQPPWGPFTNQIINTGIQMGYDSKYFWKYFPHAYTQAYVWLRLWAS